MKYVPEEDGITHVNVYSKGKTELGRLLSNFAHTPFVLAGVGQFQSVEGWWYWKLTGRAEFMDLWGWKAKDEGKKHLQGDEYMVTDDVRQVYAAKLEAHPNIRAMLKANTLPFSHYYVYGGKIVSPVRWQWTAELWNDFK